MEPCSQCIMQAMCINKDWRDIVDGCSLICDYLCDNCDPEKQNEFMHIKSLNKTFTVTAGKDSTRNMFMIGELWKPTVDRDGLQDGVFDYHEVRLVYDDPNPTQLLKTYERKIDDLVKGSDKEE